MVHKNYHTYGGNLRNVDLKASREQRQKRVLSGKNLIIMDTLSRVNPIQGSVSEISNATGVDKSNVYKALTRLTNKKIIFKDGDQRDD